MKSVYLALRCVEMKKKIIIVVVSALCVFLLSWPVKSAAQSLLMSIRFFWRLQPYFTETGMSFLEVISWLRQRLSYEILLQASNVASAIIVLVSSSILMRISIMASLYCPDLPSRSFWIDGAHGKSISDFANKTWHEWVEYSALFATTGEKIIETTCFAMNTAILSDDTPTTGTILIHNHPLHLSPLSGNDFETALSCRLASMIAVDRGKKVHVLEVPKACWQLNSEEVKKYWVTISKRHPFGFKACKRTAEKYGMIFKTMTLCEFCRMAEERGWN